MGLLTEGTSASERRRKSDLKDGVLAALDEMLRGGMQSVRLAELQKNVAENASVSVETAEVNEALRALEAEGKVLVSGEGQRKSVRRVTGVA